MKKLTGSQMSVYCPFRKGGLVRRFARYAWALLLFTAPVHAAQLTANAIGTIRTVDLTSEGTLDWMHFGRTVGAPVNRKAGISPQLLAQTLIGPSQNRFPSDPAVRSTMHWSDGTPRTSEAGWAGGYYYSSIGGGFRIDAPADTSVRTLVVHTGGWNSNGNVRAYLSDGSAAEVNIPISGSDVYANEVTVSYSAASAGQTLSVEVLLLGGTGNVVLQATTLAGAPANQLPQFVPLDDQQVTVNTPLSFPVAASDADGPAPLQLSLANATPNLPASAIFTDNGGGSGTFSWTPGVDDIGSYAVTFRATEDGGIGDYAEVTMSIDVVANQAPVLGSIGNKSVTAGSALQFDVSATDNDGPAPLVLTLQGAQPVLPAAAQFADLGNGVGSFDWTPGVADIGDYQVTFRAREDNGNGNFSEETIQISVTDVASGNLTVTAPSVAPFTNDLTAEGSLDWMHWGLVNKNTVNRKAGVASLLGYQILAASWGRFGNGPTFRPTHVWSDGTPTGNQTGFSGGIYVSEANGAIEITAPADTTTRTLKVHLGGWSSSATLDVSLSDNSATPYQTSLSGADVYQNEVTVVYRAASSGQTVTLALTKPGAGGNITLQAASLAGEPANQPPQIAAVGDKSVTAGNVLTFDVSASDADGPAPLVLSMPSSSPGLPAAASFIDGGNGTGTFSWAPTVGDIGSYQVTFRAAEDGGAGQFAEQTITLEVVANQAPVLAAIGDRTVTQGNELAFSISAADADGPAPLVLSIQNSTPALPAGATFVDNDDGTGGFSWTPGPGDVGSYSVTFRAREDNGAGQFDEETITIAVNEISSGSLTAVAPATSPFLNDLTAEGSLDWMHWGLTNASSINRKSGVTQQLTYAVVGANPGRFGANNTVRPRHAWSDGTPTAGNAGFSGGVYFPANGQGFQITAPADQDTRTLLVHLGGWNSTGHVTVTLSDGSAAQVDLDISGPAVFQHTLTVTYNAANAGQTVTVQYTKTSGSGNIILQAATLAGAPPPLLPFSDDFADGDLSGWLIVDEAGNASNWQVVSQSLRQLNGIESVSARDGTYQLGSYAIWTGGSSLVDYRFAVQAEYLGTELAEDVGVLFRYQDVNNFYRLALNSRQSYTRLEKRVGGQFTTLAVNSRGYRPGEVQNLEIEVRDTQIFVWINGDAVFAVDDAGLAGGTIGLYAKDVMRFDNVSVQEPVSTAYVVLSTPIAYTTAASGNISATAQVANMPAGGSVEFLLDGGASTVVNTAPFTAQFAGAGAGNHTVEAVLRNAVNTEIDRDTNLLIGRTGEVVVGIGDSITDGIGDSFRSDNISALERVIGFQGYEAPLTDKLDATRVATPTIVINEGIGGDETFDAAFVRIDSILERHPDANRMLILLGTNDTFVPVDPGTGCSGSACDLTYKGNMQALVDKIIWADYPTNSVPSNIVPVIALGPPVFTGASPWTSAANDRIRAYHDVIQTEISGAQVGPDMFDYFMPNASTLRRSLFADNLHPNSLGYEVMAVLWHNALEPASPLALPFVLEDVTSSVATLPRQTLVENGDLIRQSGSVTVSNIPATLNGGRWVLTENDFSNTSADYLQFTVDRNVTVYIAYDAGATSRPNWMSTFVDTGLSVTTTDNNGPSLNLWSKTFSAGTVTLGGNAAAGASGSDSNYVAIIVEN